MLNALNLDLSEIFMQRQQVLAEDNQNVISMLKLVFDGVKKIVGKAENSSCISLADENSSLIPEKDIYEEHMEHNYVCKCLRAFIYHVTKHFVIITTLNESCLYNVGKREKSYIRHFLILNVLFMITFLLFIISLTNKVHNKETNE